METKIVWVLEKGWDYEGREICGIFSSKEKGIKRGEEILNSSQTFDTLYLLSMNVDDEDTTFSSEEIILK